MTELANASLVREQLARGYFPTQLTPTGKPFMWEHVSWSKAFPGVLPAVIKALEVARAHIPSQEQA